MKAWKATMYLWSGGANMSRLLCTDFVRMYSKRRVWFYCIAIFVVSVMFVAMQYTAMDYEVSLDRVIFYQ